MKFKVITEKYEQVFENTIQKAYLFCILCFPFSVKMTSLHENRT